MFESELTQDDYFEAARFSQRNRADAFKPWRSANVIGAGAGFALLLGSGTHSWGAPVLLIGLGMFNIVFPILRQSTDLERSWTEYSQRWGRAQYEFCDQLFKVQRPHASTHYNWYGFKKLVETRSLFLLFRTDTAFEIIPKRACPDLPRIRAFLNDKLVRSEPAFPVVQR